MLAFLALHVRFVRTPMLLLVALPLLRFALEIAGLPRGMTRFASMTGFLVLLTVYLPYRMVRRSFGTYWSLWLLVFLCLFAGYGTVALLVLLNHYHPMATFFAENSGAPFGYRGSDHVRIHFLAPLYFTPLFALPASLFYFLFRSLRRTIGGGRYTG